MVQLAEIENRAIAKPYLGGWRHKITGTRYLNAASQTGPRPSKLPWDEACSRSVQTKETRDDFTQPPRERATQMCRSDCFVSSVSDRYATSGPYETYEELQLRLDYNGKARVIQRNYRAYRLGKYIKECAREYRRIVEDCRKREEQKALAYRKRHQREILCMTYPQTRADFDMLYSLIETWRRDRIGNTQERLFHAGRCAENDALLKKTIEMLAVIDRQKIAIRESYRRKKRVRFLTVNCAPIKWNGYKGRRVEMITLNTQKARDYKRTYDALCDNNVTAEERIKLLNELRKSVEKHNCVSAFELVHLLDQETRLLSIGVREERLHCLRERLIYAYLHLVSTYSSCVCDESNREWRRLSDCEDLTEPLDPKTILCKGCLKLLPYHRFSAHSRMRRLSLCVSCTTLQRRSFNQINYDPYIFLLNSVRVSERRQNCYSALAFMMQKEDVYHLVNTIWHGRSAVSENGNLFLLRLIRYRSDREWAPWNCILLTEEEAEIHRRVENLERIYSRHLLHQIFLAHQIAKNHFKQLSAFEKDFRVSSRYYMIQDRIDYEPPVTVDNYDATRVYP